MASAATPSSSRASRAPRASATSGAGARPARSSRPRVDDDQDADAPLARYHAKRDFEITSEPGPVRGAAGQLSFVIQKHDATRLHYDFRLELDGVLLSWAVPKGPSLDPKERRLAVHVEDHPVAYGTFEGTIPKGQYGAGTVIVWDNGTWEPVGDARAGLKAGKLVFRLHGKKLAGLWELVKIAKPGERQEPWLLFKKHDEWERPHADYDVVQALPDSVMTHPMKPLDRSAGSAAPTAASSTQAAAKTGATTTSTARKTPTRRKTTTSDWNPASLPGAVEAALPETLSPQLATLSKSAPTHGDWIYEIKFDGYRLLTRIDQGRATIFTRGGHDWTHKLRGVAADLEALGLRDGWLDGEAVVLDEQGRPRFNKLQNALDASRSDAVAYYVFDLPFLDGHDLREVPLHARRALLKRIVESRDGEHLRFSDDFPADAAQVLRSACDLQLEGVIAKRRDGAYTSSRNTDWLKLKCQARQEFVIGGFTDRSDNANAVGGLALGYYDVQGTLQYAGRVGTGWSHEEATELRARLTKLTTDRSPFPAGTTRSTRWMTRPAAADHWVRPTLVAEISFAEWTPDGSLRHPSFQGLRSDKPATSVVREEPKAPPTSERAASPALAASGAPAASAAKTKTTAKGKGKTTEAGPVAKASSTSKPTLDARPGMAEVAGVRLTHPDRVIDAASGHTKLDLARYYESIAPWMLPHLKSRPASLVRAPDGVGGELFFQKHADVRTLPGVLQLPDLWEGHGPLLEVPTAQALVAAAQMNVIEFHTWNSVKQKVDKPDRMIFDLDPGEGVAFATVREGAQLMRTLLEELGLRCWLKTSGGKGLHVVVPMAARLDYDTVKAFSHTIVDHLARAIPQRFVAKSGPANRVGKIFVDYLRNGFNSTTATAFSARARPGLGVSMPISWDELDEVKSGAQWTISTARDRLSFQATDPWADYAACKQTMTAAMKALKNADDAA